MSAVVEVNPVVHRGDAGDSPAAGGRVLRVTLYRLRSTARAGFGGLAGVAIVIALIGGVAMASIAAGRRTQSSYPEFLASTNPSDLDITYFGGPAPAEMTEAVDGLPDVAHVESSLELAAVPLAADGTPRLASLADFAATAGSGLATAMDRPVLVDGRMFDPTRTDQVVMTAEAAKVLGVRVGQKMAFGLYDQAQTQSPDFGSAKLPPAIRVDATVVGIVVINVQLVQDDVDRLPATVVFTPALADEASAEALGTFYRLQFDRGAHDVAAAELAFLRKVPAGVAPSFHTTARIEAQVERSIRPDAIALGGFGAIAALVALLIAGQAIARHLQAGDGDREMLSALGAEPAMAMSADVVGLLAAIVVGAVLAVALAVAISPLGPLGPVRAVYPTRGIAFDWTVLVAGSLVLVIVLGITTVVAAWRRSGKRPAGGRRRSQQQAIARMTSSAALPVTAGVGVRFALDAGRGRSASSVRAALVGTVLATLLVTATLTFASGLSTLVSHPALYGWNWSYAIFPTDHVPPQATALLNGDRDVESWATVRVAPLQIDGQTVPALVGTPGAEPSPPVVSGHGLAADDQIVLGVATLALLHKHVGDTVVASYGSPEGAPEYVPPTTLRIAGTVTLPAIGWPSLDSEHTSMGTGAYVSIGLVPQALLQAGLSPDPTQNGPDLVFVRLRAGLDAAAGRADIQRIVAAGNAALTDDPKGSQGNSISALGVQRPAEIVNYRTIGSTPTLLAAGLALGAAVALGLTLVASVRRRRRELAILKALGFTNRQLAATIAWQASTAAIVGVVVGIPLGVILGRQLWLRFARTISAVPEATVPALAIVLVACGAVVFANLVAALPGRAAAHTQTAALLQND
jgi:hypothetical protein